MNTNSTQGITATISTGIMAGVIGMAVTSNLLVGAAIGVSYLTVAGLIAMAASDYRPGSKPYYAAPVVTADFSQKTSAPATPSVKGRLAA